jgi:phage gp29-like protein
METNLFAGIQTFLQEAGETACYALSIIKIAERITGRSIEPVTALVDGIEKKRIRYNWNDQDDGDNFFVADPAALLAALTIPYINLNFGEQENYPKIDLFKPDEKNVEQIISAVEKLGPQGLKVKADEVRSLLGLSNPDDGDEVIGGRLEYGFPAPGAEPGEPEKPNLNAEQGADPDALDALIDESASGYILVSEDIATVIQKAADAATDFESFRSELEKLVKDWPPDKIAECIAVATFKARALGDTEFDEGE